MAKDFYDKVAKKFGGYGYGNGRKPIYKSEYPTDEPEKIFKEKLLDLKKKPSEDLINIINRIINYTSKILQ